MHLVFAFDKYTDVTNKHTTAEKIANNVMDTIRYSREATGIEPSQSKLDVMAYQWVHKPLCQCKNGFFEWQATI